MKFLVLASLLVNALAGVTSCGGAFPITKLSQTPDLYVKPGDNVTLTLLYDVPSNLVVSAGIATSSMTLNGIPFSPSTENLCTKVPCPIIPGSYDGSSWTTFPSGVLGKITSRVVWKDSNGQQLLCLDSTMKATTSTNQVYGPVSTIPFFTKPSKITSTSTALTIPYSEFFGSSGGSSSGSSGGSSSGNSTATGSGSGSGSGTGSGSSSGSGSGSVTVGVKKHLRSKI